MNNSEKLVSNEERERFNNSSFEDNAAQLQYLLDQQILMLVDWKGEEENEIGAFLQRRALLLEPSAKLDIDAEYNQLRCEVDSGKLLTGDAVPFLLKAFQKQLKQYALSIVLLETGSDSYLIGLVTQKDLKSVVKVSDDFWPYVAYGSKKGEVLYTVICDCGSMNVWQLKRSDVLTDDYCQDCGKMLFDREGKATMPVNKDYI